MASLESAARESRAVSSSTASMSQSTKSKKQETKKRRVLTLEENINWSKQLRIGRNTLLWLNVLTRLCQFTISTIMKKKDDIVQRQTKEDDPDLDKALSEWFCKVRAMNIPVSGPLLQEKAQYFAGQLRHGNFKASNGFLDKFKERHGITGQAVYGKVKSVDPGIVETCSEHLRDIFLGYSTKDHFNAEETGFK